jgi:hypothetical protein
MRVQSRFHPHPKQLQQARSKSKNYLNAQGFGAKKLIRSKLIDL